MNIATLGVKIDPAEAVSGRKIAEEAARGTAEAFKRADATIGTANAGIAKTTKEAAQSVGTSAAATTAAIESTGKSGAFDRLKAAAGSMATGVRAAFAQIQASVSSLGTNNTAGTATGFEKLRAQAESMATGVRTAFSTVVTSARDAGSQIGAAGKSFVQSFIDIGQAAGLMSGPWGSAVTQVAAFARTISTFISNAKEARKAGEEAAAGVDSAGKAASSAAGGFAAMLALLGPLAIALAAVAAVAVGLGVTFAALKSGISKAADFETMETQFAVLLGSFQKAEDRMKELKQFAAATPFELPGIVKASLTLQRYGGDTLATGKSLKMMGDAAAMAQQPIEEIALHVGRLYDGLKNGQAVGESVQRLNELGIVSGRTKVQIEAMTKSGNEGGKAFATLWAGVEKDLLKANNAMLLMSFTWKGIMSNIGDAWDQTLAALGKPVMLALKPAAQELATQIGNLEPIFAAVGERIAGIATTMHAAIQILLSDGGGALTMNAAADAFSENLQHGFRAAWVVFEALAARAAWEFGKLMAETQKPEFWKGLQDALYNAGVEFKNALTSGLREAYNLALKIADVLSAGAVSLSQKFGALQKWEAEGLRAGTAGGPTGPAPALVGMGDAWQQTEMVGPPSKAQVDYMTQLREREANLKAMNDKGRDDSLLPPVQKATPPADVIEKGKKTNLLKKYESERDAVIKSIETPSEKLDATMKQLKQLQDMGMINMDQFARASAKAKDEYLKNVEEMANKTRTPLEKLMHQWADMRNNLLQLQVDMTNAVANNISGNLAAMANGSKSTKQAFDDMANGILNDIEAMIIKMLIQLAIQKLLGAAFGVDAGPSYSGSLAVKGEAPKSYAGKHHTGGMVGSPVMFGSVHPAAWGNANRYAVGGQVPGVSSGERAIIAEPGEQVLTRDQASDIRKRMGEKNDGQNSGGNRPQQNLTILNVQSMAEVERHLASNPHIILNVMSKERSRVKSILG